jgi:predicted Zn-dependent peptidase
MTTPPDPDIVILPGGLRLITTVVPSAQSVASALYVRVGSRDEDPRTNGLSHYIEHMLFKGTTKRPTAPEISEAWNNLPFERLDRGLEVLGDMLQHSLLLAEEIERERTVVQQEIRRTHDQPGSYVGELLSKVTWGDQPIGWPIAGSIDTVGAMQRDDFVAHMNAFYTASNSVLSVAGNIDPVLVREIATREFTSMPGGTAPPQSDARADRPEEHILIEERELEQTNVALSAPGLPRRDPDRFALDIMSTVLGRGMSSRLFKEVRERRGLAYSVSSGATRHRDVGNVSVSAGVTRAHQEEALQVIVAELARIADEPMTEEELERTKEYSVGSFRLSLETPASRRAVAPRR